MGELATGVDLRCGMAAPRGRLPITTLLPGPRPPTRASKMFGVASLSAAKVTRVTEMALLLNDRALAAPLSTAITMTHLIYHIMICADMINRYKVNAAAFLIEILSIIARECKRQHIKMITTCAMKGATKRRDLKMATGTILVPTPAR